MQELDRLKRYASWIRRLEVREWGISEEITRLVLPSSDGTPPDLALYLQELIWRLNETNSSFLLNFLSPYLTTIVISTDELTDHNETVEPWDELPDEVVPMMRTAIEMFPYSARIVCLRLGIGPETRLTEDVSAYVLGCREALREFATNVVLSTQAISPHEAPQLARLDHRARTAAGGRLDPPRSPWRCDFPFSFTLEPRLEGRGGF